MNMTPNMNPNMNASSHSHDINMNASSHSYDEHEFKHISEYESQRECE